MKKRKKKRKRKKATTAKTWCSVLANPQRNDQRYSDDEEVTNWYFHLYWWVWRKSWKQNSLSFTNRINMRVFDVGVINLLNNIIRVLFTYTYSIRLNVWTTQDMILKPLLVFVLIFLCYCYKTCNVRVCVCVFVGLCVTVYCMNVNLVWIPTYLQYILNRVYYTFYSQVESC